MPKKVQKKLRAFPNGMTLCYVGDGKGKTTAAVGLAVRARGYNWRVLFFQFFKSEAWKSGERTSLRNLGIKVSVRGEGFVGILGDTKPKSQHKAAAESALVDAYEEAVSGSYKLVILDEIITCIEEGLLTQQRVVEFLKKIRLSRKGKEVHLALTGHQKYPKIVAQCDLVTDMRMVKHPYYSSYLALKGIDF